MQRILLYSMGAFAILSCDVGCTLAQLLQYDFTKDQKVSYEYDVQIDSSDSLISYKGIVNYSVTAVNEQLVRLAFSGGLTEQTKSTSNKDTNFGRTFPRPPNLPLIFTQTNFTGKSQSKNTIAMSRSGQVLTLDGTSQLPFLLGNLSLIPFEQLPAEEKKTWKSDSGVSITDDLNAMRYSFRPFGPFAFQPAERMQLASEVSQYAIVRNEEGVVIVAKDYAMKTPETGDRESYQMTGKGTWSFDTKDHMPASSDMKYTLIVKDGNTTTTFPIRLKFTKLSAERLMAIQAEAKANLEKSQKLNDERKVQAKAPIVGKELEDLLAQLSSTSPHEQHSGLIKLMHKEDFVADPKLVEAIRKTANSGAMFASSADRVLQQLDPVHKINKAYEGPGFVESSQLIVDSATEIYEGQIVQIREHGSAWHAAEVTGILPDGKIAVRYRGWGKRSANLLRNQIQLAPKEVIQPKRSDSDSRPKSKPFPPSAARTWSDGSGSFKVEATYMGADGDKVFLMKTDGKEVAVPLSRLSVADQRFVAQVQVESKKLGNPFDQ